MDRVAFEEWLQNKFRSETWRLEKDSTGQYKQDFTRHCWEGWQASSKYNTK